MKQAVMRYQEIRRDTADERQRTVERFLPLVRRVAFRIASRLPEHCSVEDLISAGVLGLLDAVDKFDPSRGTHFAGYAELRIRGSILDELRHQDSLSRLSRRRHRELERARHDLATELGRLPDESEVAAHMGIKTSDVRRRSSRNKPPVIVPLDALGAWDERKAAEARQSLRFGNGEDPFQNLLMKQMKSRALDAMRSLSERLQMVLSLYYAEDLSYKQIAEVLGVTESRICQMHSEAVSKMRSYLEGLDAAGDARRNSTAMEAREAAG